MVASKDFEELLASFRSHKVRFLVVGAHAVAFYAKPRYTKDVDVFLEPTAENAARVMAALTDFGFGDIGLTAADFTETDRVVQLGVPPNRIDLLTGISGVSFAEAWSGRVEGAFGSERVTYIGKEALIRNKLAAGRPQDAIDVESLRRARG